MYGQLLPFWTPRYYGHPDNTFAFANFALPGGSGICQPQGQPQTFDTHAVSYQTINTPPLRH